jgi:hypothetical protein
MRTAARIDAPKSGDLSASFTANRCRAPTDDGASWQKQLERELFALSWRRWQIDLQLAPGEHHLRSGLTARARCRTRERPYPSGSSGYHSIE